MSELSPKEIAEKVYAARQENDGSAKAGLEKLQDEYDSYMKTHSAQKTDEHFKTVLKELDSKLILSGIVNQSIADRVSPGEVITRFNLAYDAKTGHQTKDLNVGSGLDTMLAQKWDPEITFYDTTRWSGIIPHNAASDNALDMRVQKEEVLFREREIVHMLQAKGPNGELWRILQNQVQEGTGKYTKPVDLHISPSLIQDVENRRTALQLSPEQLKALETIRDKWETPMVKDLRTSKVTEYDPVNPIDNFRYKPSSRLKPWNYKDSEKTGDYITLDNIAKKTGIDLRK